MHQVATFLFAAVSAVSAGTRPLAKRPVSEFVEKARAAYAAEAHCPCTNSVWAASMHALGAFNDIPVPVRIEWARSGDVGATYTLSLRAKTASEPVRVLAEDVAGIAPLEPGYARFEVAPCDGDAYRELSVAVPTPTGQIRFSRDGGGVRIRGPLGRGAR